MKTATYLVIAGLLAVSLARAEVVTFAKAGVTLDAPEGWTLDEQAGKAILHSPDQTGKIQVFNVSLPGKSFDKVVEEYQAATFKDKAAPRPGQKIEVLESGKFQTTAGAAGYKGAYGYKDGADHQPEVWTWRYFFQKPKGGIVCVCSFVYGDKERATAQEAIIANSLQIAP